MRLLLGLLTVLSVVGTARAASRVSRGPVFHDSHPVFSPDGRTIAFDVISPKQAQACI
jgi:hypothetical protein